MPDLPAPSDDPRQQLALFRFGVIADLLSLERGSSALRSAMREKARRRWDIPGSRRTRIAFETLRDWLAAYRRDGYEGLFPKRRSDRGCPRSLTPDVVALLLRLKQRYPKLSAAKIISLARQSGQVAAEVTLAPATVYRLFHRHGLMRPAGPPPPDRRRFAYKAAGELWQADVMHGPKIGSDPQDRRRRSKSYLIAFLDDATRLVPHAAFTLAENAVTFLPVFKRTLLKRGLPTRLYVDNGSNFRSRHLSVTCATLGIHLIHSTPYKPQGRGKIERFFGTVRSQFLPLLEDADRRSPDALNARLAVWIEREYHLTPHRGLQHGETPLDAWTRTAAGMRLVGPDTDLDALFCLRFQRRVQRDATVSLHSLPYEVDSALIGQKVVLLQDPEAPPGRPLQVLHRERPAGQARLVDTYANTRVKRTGKPLQPQPALAPEPEPSPLCLHELDTASESTASEDTASEDTASEDTASEDTD